MVNNYKKDDIHDLSRDEAMCIIKCVEIAIMGIESGNLDMPNKDTFMLLAKSSHAKLTNKDQGIIARV